MAIPPTGPAGYSEPRLPSKEVCWTQDSTHWLVDAVKTCSGQKKVLRTVQMAKVQLRLWGKPFKIRQDSAFCPCYQEKYEKCGEPCEGLDPVISAEIRICPAGQSLEPQKIWIIKHSRCMSMGEGYHTGSHFEGEIPIDRPCTSFSKKSIKTGELTKNGSSIP